MGWCSRTKDTPVCAWSHAQHGGRVEAAAQADGVAVFGQPVFGAGAAQRMQPGEESPLGVGLARRAQCAQRLAAIEQVHTQRADAFEQLFAIGMAAAALAGHELLQQRDQPQFLEQAGVEGDLVDAVEDVLLIIF